MSKRCLLILFVSILFSKANKMEQKYTLVYISKPGTTRTRKQQKILLSLPGPQYEKILGQEESLL